KQTVRVHLDHGRAPTLLASSWKLSIPVRDRHSALVDASQILLPLGGQSWISDRLPSDRECVKRGAAVFWVFSFFIWRRLNNFFLTFFFPRFFLTFLFPRFLY